MMTFYSGTPGSGKSLHVAREIYNYLTFYKKNIITNIYINLDKVQGIKRDKKGNIKKIKHKSIGNYIYKNIHELSVEYLIAYSEHYHKHGKEGQTILIIDEAQTRFNPRMNPIDRLSWVHFFVEHRHLGFDVIVISPNLRLIDRQIRYNFEYEVQHRKANNNGILGLLLPFKLFVAVTVWANSKDVAFSEMYLLRKKYISIYDSYADADVTGLMLDLKLLDKERSLYHTKLFQYKKAEIFYWIDYFLGKAPHPCGGGCL